MRYGSVCSGIEAATVAWHPLGWTPAWFAEIEPFPCAVLAHHYPRVPNLGDMTAITEADLERHGPIELLVGGTPCQSFSVAGLRGGLDDPRGNLALRFLQLAGATRAKWLVWENVPGVLSSNGGRDFGAILGGLAKLRYGWAYRILDAQYFGVPQRRRRVFVVGHLGDWRLAAAVLFERHSLPGHPAPSRETGPGTSRSVAASLRSNGAGTSRVGDTRGQDNVIVHCEPVSRALTACKTATGRLDPNEMEFVAHSLRADGFDVSEDGTGRGTPLVPVGVVTNCSSPVSTDGSFCPTLRVGTGLEINSAPAVAFQERGREGGRSVESQADLAYSLTAPNGGGRRHEMNVAAGMAVRRLTPRECERLQGFPDDYTLIPFRGKPAADGPRYRALGNSMCTKVMRWIAERIQSVYPGEDRP